MPFFEYSSASLRTTSYSLSFADSKPFLPRASRTFFPSGVDLSSNITAFFILSLLSNFNYQKIDEVCHCIETHRFRSGRKPETIEAKVLHDADRLDVIGAIGIARAYTFGGENKLQIYPPKPRQNLTKADSVYTSDWNAVYEFQVKLSKVKDSMLTGEGRRMAEGRHAFMVKFFERLEDEINGKP